MITIYFISHWFTKFTRIADHVHILLMKWWEWGGIFPHFLQISHHFFWGLEGNGFNTPMTHDIVSKPTTLIPMDSFSMVGTAPHILMNQFPFSISCNYSVIISNWYCTCSIAARISPPIIDFNLIVISKASNCVRTLCSVNEG